MATQCVSFEQIPLCDRRLLVRQSLLSRAPSTVTKYLSEHRKFISFLSYSSQPTKLPSDSLHISLYLAYLSQTKQAIMSCYKLIVAPNGSIPYCPRTKPEILRTALEPIRKKQPVSTVVVVDMVKHGLDWTSKTWTGLKSPD